MSVAPSHLDAGQVLPAAFDETTDSLRVIGGGAGGSVSTTIIGPVDSTNGFVEVEVMNTLITKPYDAINLIYYSSGPGINQIETAQYYLGGLSGTLVGTLTLTYNSGGNLATVVKT